MSTALKAKWVFTGEGPPLQDAVVRFDHQAIRYVGKADGPAVDCGDAVILPGLVNAHTHLEFSQLTEPLLPAGAEFATWIRRVVQWRREQQAAVAEGEDWRGAAIVQGWRESLQAGTTLLGEISTPPWQPDLYRVERLVPRGDTMRMGEAGEGGCSSEDTSRKQGLLFLELLGFREERHAALQQMTVAFLEDRHACQLVLEAGLSPHAPYTIAPRFLQWVAETARQHRRRLAMHLAESRAELELLATSSGSLRQLLDDVQAWQPGQIAIDSRPLDYLRILAAAEHTLVVHGNYLDAAEIDFLGQHRDRFTVVYCPRTHHYFGHEKYPLARLLQTGARVALGTDSRGSNPDLSLLSELRHVAQAHPDIAPEAILHMGTLAGAEALGYAASCGSLRPGKRADLIVLPIEPKKSADPYATWLESGLPPRAVYQQGVRISPSDPGS